MAKKRIGNQTPTRSVFLPYKKSEYKKAVEVYEKSGRKVFKWQVNLLKPMLARGEVQVIGAVVFVPSLATKARGFGLFSNSVR